MNRTFEIGDAVTIVSIDATDSGDFAGGRYSQYVGRTGFIAHAWYGRWCVRFGHHPALYWDECTFHGDDLAPSYNVP